MDISQYVSNNMFAFTDLHDDKSITDEFRFVWHEVVSHYLHDDKSITDEFRFVWHEVVSHYYLKY